MKGPEKRQLIRGGMSANAFGGHDRLDKLDLSGPSEVGGKLLDVASNVQPERLLWLSTIQDALNNYLEFGLGQNGTTEDEFWFAAEYLFNVRAADPESWKDAQLRASSRRCWLHRVGRRRHSYQRDPSRHSRRRGATWHHRPGRVHRPERICP